MTNRSFTNTPLATQTRSGSQPLIQGNFLYLVDQTTPSVTAGMLAVDHKVTGTSGTTFDGFHNQVSMLQQTTPVALTNAVNGQVSDSIDYVLNDAQGSAQLHHLTKLNGTATLVDYQVTPCLPMRAACYFTYGGGPPTVTLLGTPINVLVGNIVRNATAGNFTITFTQPLPSANYNVSISTRSGPTNSAAYVQTATANAITVQAIVLNSSFTPLDWPMYIEIFGG